MSDLDRKVAQAMGLKSVNNCEKWGKDMTEEDEAFNEIERKAKQRMEAVRVAINKPTPTYFTEEHAISMTLRDYFAAKAMQAWESRSDLDDISDVAKAKRFYELADAMLKAREA